jgi:hypothetical protein
MGDAVGYGVAIQGARFAMDQGASGVKSAIHKYRHFTPKAKAIRAAIDEGWDATKDAERYRRQNAKGYRRESEQSDQERHRSASDALTRLDRVADKRFPEDPRWTRRLGYALSCGSYVAADGPQALMTEAYDIKTERETWLTKHKEREDARNATKKRRDDSSERRQKKRDRDEERREKEQGRARTKNDRDRGRRLSRSVSSEEEERGRSSGRHYGSRGQISYERYDDDSRRARRAGTTHVAPQVAMPQGYHPQAAVPQQYHPQAAMPQQYHPQTAMPQQYHPQAVMRQGYHPQVSTPQAHQPLALTRSRHTSNGNSYRSGGNGFDDDGQRWQPPEASNGYPQPATAHYPLQRYERQPSLDRASSYASYSSGHSEGPYSDSSSGSFSWE